jgi:hypothetical protein
LDPKDGLAFVGDATGGVDQILEDASETRVPSEIDFNTGEEVLHPVVSGKSICIDL